MIAPGRHQGPRPAARRSVGWAGSVGLVLAAVTVTACGSGSSAASRAADQAYLAEVHDSAPDIGTERNDTQLVRLGHAACDGFSAGASYVQLADRLALLEGSHPLPSQDLGAVITAAADNYCPQYRVRVS